MAEPKLTAIMERIGHGPGPSNFAMWACRGEGKGCKRNKIRRKAVHCDDCLPMRNDETLQNVLDRLKRGDA